MSKRPETLHIEELLKNRCKEKRLYGCEEVTIGFPHNRKRIEIVDFMHIDCNDIISCYEIKVTKEDLKSKAAKSWCGHYNYLVLSKELYSKLLHELNDVDSIKKEYNIPKEVGIIMENDDHIESKSKALKIDVSSDMVDILKTSLCRSLYYKMDKYSRITNSQTYKETDKEIKKLKRELSLERQDKIYYLNEFRKLRSIVRHIKRNHPDIMLDTYIENIENTGK